MEDPIKVLAYDLIPEMFRYGCYAFGVYIVASFCGSILGLIIWRLKN
jgi:hypothetical protein